MGHTVAGSFIGALFGTLMFLLNLYTWVLIARMFMSWISPDPSNPIVQFIYRITEPVLAPFRRIIPPISGIDFSPIVVFIAIQFLQRLLANLFRGF
ncbi:YggT family protein [Chrysiogenes arsenatis]|uniref:YggT family protein n=1 Tax=Chrysiogenes arsenatis TaxID=309797 RepID=UPI0003FC35F7|nr:YggT family protein [Chrysiogenes arsenatis]